MAGTSRTLRHFPESGDYLTFVEEFLLKNEPCLFQETLTRGWRARREWQRDGKPDLDHLASEFGDASVPVADCSKEHFDSHCKTEMTMADYLQYWRGLNQRGGGAVDEKREEREEREEALLYLKDWHFYKQYPQYAAYSVPPYFSSDWLNELWDYRQDVMDDYRFVYMGPKGTWTPFHADVFRSYSWSANVCGRKEWTLFPPGEEDRVRDTHGKLPFDLRKHPGQRWRENCICIVQEAGEVIFVPSGWYHQVHNLEDTISINHNWTNACGVFSTWRHLQSELQQVKREISDCRSMAGWENHCQVVLRACVGMDYLELLQMLCLLALPRLAQLDSLLTTPPPHPSFTALRQTIARVISSRELSLFGTRDVHSGTAGVESLTGPALTDGLKDTLGNCSMIDTSGNAGSCCLHGVLQCLPEGARELVVGDGVCDTLRTLRIFELHQISKVLTELLTDADMQAVTPQDIR